jgi:ankyrin repeat protein
MLKITGSMRCSLKQFATPQANFNLLIARGVDVNKACEGYVPRLMHAAKYGLLAIVRILVSKGANVNYQYNGEYKPASGETPATLAEKNNQPEIATYLRSLKK